MIDLTLEIAEKAAGAARTKAHELGTPMTVTVVDEAGRLVLCARGDGAGFFSPETSRAKAVAAAAWRRPTIELMELAAQGSQFWNTVPAILAGQVLPSIGGVPIVKGGRVIGAIGCGGGTGEQDHLCAVAGAEAVRG